MLLTLLAPTRYIAHYVDDEYSMVSDKWGIPTVRAAAGSMVIIIQHAARIVPQIHTLVCVVDALEEVVLTGGELDTGQGLGPD